MNSLPWSWTCASREAYDAAIQALHELEEMARTGAPPFDKA